jgi:hypothetical protein
MLPGNEVIDGNKPCSLNLQVKSSHPKDMFSSKLKAEVDRRFVFEM